MTEVIILAAGKGARLKEKHPKVLVPVGNKPMIDWVLSAVLRSGITYKPVVVVGHRAPMIIDYLGGSCRCVYQAEQLGSGHAVSVCRRDLAGKAGTIAVVNGDMPFVHPDTLAGLAQAHRTSPGSPIALVTCDVGNFEGDRAVFRSFGRIIRDANGCVQLIREFSDASDRERCVTEVNAGIYSFDAAWLWQHIDRIAKDNAQGEYYLTDLVEMALGQGSTVADVRAADPWQLCGVNTQQDLQLARRMASAAARKRGAARRRPSGRRSSAKRS